MISSCIQLLLAAQLLPSPFNEPCIVCTLRVSLPVEFVIWQRIYFSSRRLVVKHTLNGGPNRNSNKKQVQGNWLRLRRMPR